MHTDSSFQTCNFKNTHTKFNAYVNYTSKNPLTPLSPAKEGGHKILSSEQGFASRSKVRIFGWQEFL